MLIRRTVTRILATFALVAQAIAFAAICGCGTGSADTTVMMHCGDENSGVRMTTLMSCCCDDENRATATKAVVTLSPDVMKALPQNDAGHSFVLTGAFIAWKTTAGSARRAFTPPRPPLRV